MANNILRRKSASEQRRSMNIWIDEAYKQKYEQLAAAKVLVSEHIRLVVYPEIDRLWELEFGSGHSDAG